MTFTPSEWRAVCRRLADDYGWTPEQVTGLTDAQLYDVLRGYHEAVIQDKGDKVRNEKIGRAVEEWKKTHTGEPDLFQDIIPIVNRMDD